MESSQVCAECGAAWQEGKTCQDHFHQMLFWEADDVKIWARSIFEALKAAGN